MKRISKDLLQNCMGRQVWIFQQYHVRGHHKWASYTVGESNPGLRANALTTRLPHRPTCQRLKDHAYTFHRGTHIDLSCVQKQQLKPGKGEEHFLQNVRHCCSSHRFKVVIIHPLCVYWLPFFRPMYTFYTQFIYNPEIRLWVMTAYMAESH